MAHEVVKITVRDDGYKVIKPIRYGAWLLRPAEMLLHFVRASFLEATKEVQKLIQKQYKEAALLALIALKRLQ